MRNRFELARAVSRSPDEAPYPLDQSRKEPYGRSILRYRGLDSCCSRQSRADSYSSHAAVVSLAINSLLVIECLSLSSETESCHVLILLSIIRMPQVVLDVFKSYHSKWSYFIKIFIERDTHRLALSFDIWWVAVAMQ